MSKHRVKLLPALLAAAIIAATASGCASTQSPSVSGTVASEAASTTDTSATTSSAATLATTPPSAATAKTTSAPALTATASKTSGPAPIPTGYDPSRNAQADISAAIALAKQSHRNIVLDFGADWCPDCVALDRYFVSATVKPVLEKDFIVVPIDVGQFDHNMDLSRKYGNVAAIGIPGLAVLNPSGSLLTATADGSFSNARTMTPDQVKTFLDQWLPTNS